MADTAEALSKKSTTSLHSPASNVSSIGTGARHGLLAPLRAPLSPLPPIKGLTPQEQELEGSQPKLTLSPTKSVVANLERKLRPLDSDESDEESTVRRANVTSHRGHSKGAFHAKSTPGASSSASDQRNPGATEHAPVASALESVKTQAASFRQKLEEHKRILQASAHSPRRVSMESKEYEKQTEH